MDTQKQEKVYPVQLSDGWFYENESDEDSKIETKEYENSNIVKKIVLKKGAVAIMRELDGTEVKNIRRFMDRDAEKYDLAGITVATKFDDKQWPMEEVERIKLKDYTRLILMWNSLNF